jgi:glyoxylase-like metal-dependent hydrolase (beta-lactamase superfamily II)
MSKRVVGGLLLLLYFFLARALPLQAQAADAKTLLEGAAKAMGGTQALRSLKNQVVESEGKQFDSSSTSRPGGATRQITTFRYTLTRDLTQPRMKLEWDGKSLGARDDVRYVEIIDGSVGLLQEGGTSGKQSRLHPARLATRLREEKRAAARIILVALGQKSLKRLPDTELGGKHHHVLAFQDSGDEFRIYLDPTTHLPAQVEILEDDPLEGDSRYTLRYADWRKVDGVQLPFSLRYALNGKALQEEQIKSVRNNVSLAPDMFSIPESIRNEKPDAKPIASQWLLRRVAGNVSYQDLGRNPPVEFVQIADGVYQIQGTSHNTIIIEMRDHVVAVEGPLYEERSYPVVKAVKERFPIKPIRYVIPTHHHLDHAGGIRGFMAEGAIVVVPFMAENFYARVAKALHTLRPDSLERNRRAVVIESYGGGPRVLTDGNRQIEIWPLPTSHAEDFQVIYLPREKILIEADHVSPRKGQVRSAPAVKELVEGIDKLNLDVTTVAGIHGDTAPMQVVRAAAQGGAR